MKPYKTLIFIILTVALLAVACLVFPAGGVEVGGVTLRMPSMARVLGTESDSAALDVEAYLADAENPELQDVRDSIEFLSRVADTADTRFWLPYDEFFDPLFARMERAAAESRTVRVVHYGDSQIEMDRMSSRLRAALQHTFGGSGAGMVPFRTIIGSPAVSIAASGSLVHQAPFGDSTVHRSRRGPYGPMIQDFRLAGQASTTIKAPTNKRVDSLLGSFQTVTLLACTRGRLNVAFGNRKASLDTNFVFDTTGVVAAKLRLDSALNTIRVNVSGDAELFGIMVDGAGGVAVDNIPMRGCSGQQFTLVDSAQLADAYRLMDVGLVIMQFGGNSVPYLRSRKPLDTYCHSIGRQIDRVRNCCPGALVLFIGPSDMSTSVNGRLQSYPYLDSVVDGLRRTALEHGAAYWSIYHAMGGHNSMTAWVSQGLGGQDYIHFSQRGADIIGDRLADAFMNLYDLYRLRRKIKN